MSSIEDKCKLKGVRLTDQRKIIAQVMSDSKDKYGARDHPDVDELHKRVSEIDENFTVLVNNGPGSFSTIRAALAVAKGIKISNNVKLFGFQDKDLSQFNLENIEVLINKNLIEKKLIKPLYLS